MPEDAFERFRRLRSVEPPVIERDGIPCPDGAQRDKVPQGVLPALELWSLVRASGVVLTLTCDYADVTTAEEAPVRPLVFGLATLDPRGALTDALRLAIQEHEAALRDLVEQYEERAAIGEYDAGLSRADAEAVAWTTLGGEGLQDGTHDAAA